MDEHTAENDTPPVEWMLTRIYDSGYDGGYDGTCYGCPFATGPLYSDGSEAAWRDVANDPTEAYYRCSLPTREQTARLAWGEYAPCTLREWVEAIKTLVVPPAAGPREAHERQER